AMTPGQVGRQGPGAVPIPRLAAHVVARAEGPARAGQDHDAHGVVHLELDHHLGEVALHRLRGSVQPFGLVERDRADAAGRRRHLEAAEAPFHGQLSRSTIMAMPWPPPTHMVSRPTPRPVVSRPFSSVVMIRAPVMPKGWPSAIAPP